MELKAKLYLMGEDGEKFMGIGVLWLLRKVEETGSLRAAASALGISYTKALGMVNKLEDELKMNVILRRKGGKDRTGAELTPFGHAFLERYDAFQNEAKKAIVEPYEAFASDLRAMMEGKDNGRETL